MGDTSSNKKTMPTLASLSSARQSATSANSLAQLRQKMQKPATSSLASLAASSNETKKPLSSLQTLAQRSNANAGAAPSLASLAANSSVEKPLSSLAHLASRQSTPKPISSARGGGGGGGSLADLASRKPSAKPALIKPPSLPAVPPATAAPRSKSPTPEESVSSSDDDEEEEEEQESMYENPLCAKPSAAAQFLFKPQQSLKFNPQAVFQQARKQRISVFEFDQPSPDDIVIAAQNQRSGKKNSIKLTKKNLSFAFSIAAAEKKAATATAASAKTVKTAKAAKTSKEEAVEFLSDEEEISQEMDAMGLGKIASTKPAAAAAAAAEPLVKVPASKRVDVAKEYEKRSGEKPKLNLVVIGHVDAGKSTLMGHFLYDLGQVNERTMRKFERESQKIGKGSFAYAWVLDETGEERDRGITMDIATNHFETEHRQFTLLDAPGHRDFIPNMISGTAQADAAILVVDASTNAFEAGFDAGGQTKEHAVLARSLGVQQLIVAINKLDMADWAQERFKEIEAKLGAYLYQVGFKKSKVVFVPVSGLTGENLVKKSQIAQLTSWYKGPSLMEQIDQFDAPMRLLDKPLRMRVTDFFKGGIGSSGGVSVAGNIESGTLQVGEQVMVVPGNEVGFVKTMQVNEEPATWAAAGDSVLMTLVNLDIMNLSNGCVLCTGAKPVPVTTTFEAQIVVFDIRVPITPGYPIVLHHGSLDEPASIIKLVEIIDKATGQVTKRNPRCLTKGMTAKIQIKLTQRPIPLESFKDNKHLGRIMLRKDGETVAAGVVNEILTFGS
ncbi:hypothetical protein [Parasitella parasitica]|uniref:Elongation factor 1 alpha-like protein n=1 Tax=Parasitella parasitica TaxID=35722 RepID=A0A0B7NF84_9FUNG|nr:hypothetical protein [Parasitella parasitica]